MERPTEGKGQRYNPLVDIDGPEAVGELAAALIPTVDDANSIFTESARDLLDALISHHRAVDGEASLATIRTLIAGVDDYKGLLRTLNDNASAQWMSDRIGVVDVTVTNESVDDWFEKKTRSSSMVTEPKVFPHELQQLKDGQVVCAYQDLAWRGWATPYFQIWEDYLGKRPAGEKLYGDPYPEKKDDAA
ncbi:MAG: hypothetical protein GDA50_08390 [Alphaproteobacteria bacterium GM202ARS2]|nr:hypothetical protein [Alphaproteobacteria bacterium GM202ARS2]